MFVRLHAFWIRLADSDQGATMPEYALIVAFIALVALVGVTAMGIGLNLRYEEIDSVVNP